MTYRVARPFWRSWSGQSKLLGAHASSVQLNCRRQSAARWKRVVPGIYRERVQMHNRCVRMALVAGLFLMHWESGVGLGQNSVKTFAYVGPNYVITAELAGKHSFVVNFINLSDFVIVIQPHDLIYKGASGRFYIGQVFEQEHKDNRGEILKYGASVLLNGRSFTGLTV